MEADRGNSVIITCCEGFKKKIVEIFMSNQFKKLNTDPTSN